MTNLATMTGARMPESSIVTLRLLLGRLTEAVDQDDPLAARGLLDDAIGLLPAPIPATEPRHTGLAPWQRRRVQQAIEDGLHERLSVPQLAADVRLSASHFSRAFQASFGQPPHAYLLARRVARAQRLMLETEEPLAQIALSCGLSDQAHLSHLFRRLTGTAPNAWRRSRRAGQDATAHRHAA